MLFSVFLLSYYQKGCEKMNGNNFRSILRYILISIPIIITIFIFSYFIGCPIRLITGIPCPACGITRAYISFFQGDFALAFSYHPLFFLLPAVLLCVISLLLTEKKPNCKARLPLIIFSVLIILIFAAVYIIRLINNLIP